ncbi:MAG TPA: cereblon family protein [Myxococcales bacterium]|nr:cereblon family protein [Myxococcales bacterium]
MLREDAQQAGGATRTGFEQVWRCARCGAAVASDRDRVPLDGSPTRVFVNPEGVEYEIAGFKEAAGCAEISEPSVYWSWFPGCAWQISVCSGCSAHLGWRFSGGSSFHGLILDRLTAP